MSACLSDEVPSPPRDSLAACEQGDCRLQQQQQQLSKNTSSTTTTNGLFGSAAVNISRPTPPLTTIVDSAEDTTATAVKPPHRSLNNNDALCVDCTTTASEDIALAIFAEASSIGGQSLSDNPISPARRCTKNSHSSSGDASLLHNSSINNTIITTTNYLPNTSSSIFSPRSSGDSSSRLGSSCVLPSLAEAAAEAASPHSTSNNDTNNNNNNNRSAASTKTPTHFLQLTPPEMPRSEGLPISQADRVKAEHKDHISSLVPIVTNVLLATIEKHKAITQEEEEKEGKAENSPPLPNNTRRLFLAAADGALFQSSPSLPGAVDDGDSDDGDSSSPHGRRHRIKEEDAIVCRHHQPSHHRTQDTETKKNEKKKKKHVDSQPEFITYETFGIEDAPTLKQYLTFFMNNAWSSPSSFVGALVLMDRYFEKHPKFRLTFLNSFKFFVVCSRVASKTIETIACGNRTFAVAARLSVASLNAVEEDFLRDMEFEVAVLKSEWQPYADQILKGLLQTA